MSFHPYFGLYITFIFFLILVTYNLFKIDLPYIIIKYIILCFKSIDIGNE